MGQSLFSYGDAADWAREPAAAFDAFLSSHRFEGRALRRSSYVIYSGMFTRLQAWLNTEGVQLLALDAELLDAFLDSRSLAPESRHRYLLVFTQLYEHLQTLEPVGNAHGVRRAGSVKPEAALGDQDAGAGNPAFQLLIAKPAPERENPEALTATEAKAFIAALSEPKTWKHERSRVMQLTLLASGLRTRELLGLRPSDLEFASNGQLREIKVRAHGVHRARTTPLLELGRKPLEAWVLKRAELAIPGALLFPADAKGGPLSAATLFRQVKATLERAGVRRRYEGPMLLRNTCAVTWLAHHPAYEVQRWLGHETLRTTELLLEAVKGTSSAAAGRVPSSVRRSATSPC